MKKLLISSILLLFTFSIYAQNNEPVIEWDKTFGGKNNDEANSIIQTTDGGFVLAGNTGSKGKGYSDFWVIKFDKNGECTYCKIHDMLERRRPLDENAPKRLKKLVEEIKKRGKNKKYDCIVGVSGGRDSTYALYMAKKLGLRPLAVHFVLFSAILRKSEV